MNSHNKSLKKKEEEEVEIFFTELELITRNNEFGEDPMMIIYSNCLFFLFYFRSIIDEIYALDHLSNTRTYRISSIDIGKPLNHNH